MIRMTLVVESDVECCLRHDNEDHQHHGDNDQNYHLWQEEKQQYA